MSRPTLSRALTALALAASLAACGGSNDESVAGPAAASPSRFDDAWSPSFARTRTTIK